MIVTGARKSGGGVPPAMWGFDHWSLYDDRLLAGFLTSTDLLLFLKQFQFQHFILLRFLPF